MIQVVADKNIPHLSKLLKQFANVTVLDGNAITPEKLESADALFVRTVTAVNAALLENTPVKFVASATAGEDHIDQSYLHAGDIAFASAKGCNAIAVTDYVTACLAALMDEKLLCIEKNKVGIIGVGAVGSCVAQRLSQLGFEVLLNDPPRAERESNFISTPLNQLSDCDIISIHTPLTHQGDHPTYHLLPHDFLQSLKPGTVLINTSRGEVISTKSLLHAKHLTLCCDVFENEPTIDTTLAQQAAISTPHIAGYSHAAKLRASLMVSHAFSDYFGVALPTAADVPQPRSIHHDHWKQQTLAIYDPRKDTQTLKENPTDFKQLRNAYALRDEMRID